MAKPTGFDWYLREWAAANDKLQADFRRALNLEKNAAHRLWHGDQPYRRDYVNQVAAWLNIRPYELLMAPAEAMALRQLRREAARIVAVSPDASTGTHG